MNKYQNSKNADEKTFDEWFFSLPKKDQDYLRDRNVLPYCEIISNQYVYEVKESHKDWGYFQNDILNNSDEFIRVEHVKTILRLFLESMEKTNDMSVRRHFEIMKLALDLPNKMSSRQLSKMYNLSHSSIQKMASEMRCNLNLISPMSANFNDNKKIKEELE